MGSCGCGCKSELFNVGDKIVLKEIYGHCGTCGQACININILDEKDQQIFLDDPECSRSDMGIWMGKGKDTICIGLKELWPSVEAFIDDAMEKVYEEDLSDEEFNVIEPHLEKLVKCLKERMKERSEDQ